MHSICITFHNKEFLAERVLRGVIENTAGEYEICIALDGCIDKTKDICSAIIKENPQIKFTVIELPDVFETISNNALLKIAKGIYSILFQDDMVATQYGFNEQLVRPMEKFNNIFLVTARDSHNVYNTPEMYGNFANASNLVKDEFGIRDVINRGPLALDMSKARELNFFDETFAPYTWDDTDLSIRGYKHKGWLCGSFPVGYISENDWGTTRNKNQGFHYSINMRNKDIFYKRHADYLAGPKHDQNITIED